MAKFMISMDDELLARVEKMAAALYTNRSAYISMTLAQAIMTQEEAMGILERTVKASIEKDIAKKE